MLILDFTYSYHIIILHVFYYHIVKFAGGWEIKENIAFDKREPLTARVVDKQSTVP